MSRWASSLNQAAAELDVIRGVFLLDLAFDSGHVRANDGGSDLSFGGNTYFGIGNVFGSFDQVNENVQVVARGIRFKLNGVNAGLVATTATEIYQGRPATLYIGMLNEQNALVDTPEIVWDGFMDTMNIEVSGQDAVITLACEHRLRNAPPYSRFSDADQQAKYQVPEPDRFFSFTAVVAGYKSTWGGKSTGWNYRPGGGYTPT